MAYPKLLVSAGLVAALALGASPASAQGRNRGRAVPRSSVRVARPPVVVAPYRTYVYRSYRPAVNLGFFYGRPGYFGSYAYGNPFYAYGYPAYGHPAYGYSAYGYPSYGYSYPAYSYVAPYGYGYGGYSGRPYGGIRIDLPERDAEVYVDGYFVGIVDNFDGVLQQANVEAGPHRIEVRAPGFETIVFDVNVEPGRTITYRGSMRPLRP
jgi:PEGA domain-containing protein